MKMQKSRSQKPRRGRRSIRNTPRGSGNFVPARMRADLKLEGTIENAASATYAEAGFTANDLFDPQGGSGAAQCPGFDQLAILYGRYRVHSSTIEVKATINSSSATPTATAMEAQVVVYPSRQSAAVSGPGDGFSQPLAKIVVISGEKPATIRHRIDLAKFLGCPPNSDRFQALVSASPAEVVYWHVGIVSRAYTTVLTDLVVSITYHCEFFERNSLDRSTQLVLHEARLKIQQMMENKETKPFVNDLKSLDDVKQRLEDLKEPDLVVVPPQLMSTGFSFDKSGIKTPVKSTGGKR